MLPYNAKLAVRVRSAEKGEQLRTLSVDLGWVSASPSSTRQLLRLQFTDDTDPLFYHFLDLSEEDYGHVKHEQQLSVEFAAFPEALMGFLDRCVEDGRMSKAVTQSPTTPLASYASARSFASSSRTKEDSLFASIAVESAASHFSIIATNHFRAITYLTLRLRPGKDTILQNHLANRIKSFQDEISSLRLSLEDVTQRYQQECGVLRDDCDQLRSKNQTLTQEYQTLSSQLSMEHAQIIARMKQEHMEQYRGVVEKYEKSKKESEEAWTTQVQELSRAKLDLEADRIRLLQANDQLSKKISDLSSRLEDVGADQSSKADLLQTHRKRIKELEEQVLSKEKECSQQSIKLVSIEQQLKGKEDIIDRMTSLLDSTRREQKTLEETLGLYKSSNLSLEEKLREASSEIQRGNTALDQLQNSRLKSKGRVRELTLLLSERDKRLDSMQEKYDSMKRERDGLERKLLEKDKEMEKMQVLVQENQAKLEDSKKLAEKQEQMISYLNSQKTRQELSRIGAHDTAVRHYSAALDYTPPRAGQAHNIGQANTTSASSPGAPYHRTGTISPLVRYQPQSRQPPGRESYGLTSGAQFSVGQIGSIPSQYLGLSPKETNSPQKTGAGSPTVDATTSSQVVGLPK